MSSSYLSSLSTNKVSCVSSSSNFVSKVLSYCVMPSVFVSILNYISIFSVDKDGSPPSPGPSVEDLLLVILKFSSSITSCLKPDPFSLSS